jgi:hypothetical protein
MITDHRGPSLTYTEFLEKLSLQLQQGEHMQKNAEKERLKLREIVDLRQRIAELEEINKAHQDLNGELRIELTAKKRKPIVIKEIN